MFGLILNQSVQHSKELFEKKITKNGRHPKHMHNYQEGCKNDFFISR